MARKNGERKIERKGEREQQNDYVKREEKVKIKP